MNRWIPGRKWFSGGVVSVAAFFIAAFSGLGDETAVQIAAGLFALISYLVPPSTAEIIDRFNEYTKRLGGGE